MYLFSVVVFVETYAYPQTATYLTSRANKLPTLTSCPPALLPESVSLSLHFYLTFVY